MKIEPTDIPNRLGVMILPGTSLFPNALLPLYIFEPKYRQMLQAALEDHRMFAIAQMVSDTSAKDKICEVGGAGIIRACVMNPDGTSNLILQGVCRVRFLEWSHQFSYRQASLARLESSTPDLDQQEELTRLLRDCCRSLKQRGIQLPRQFEHYVLQIKDPEVLSDVMSSTLISDPGIRQNLLEELDVTTRVHRLVNCLSQQL